MTTRFVRNTWRAAVDRRLQLACVRCRGKDMQTLGDEAWRCRRCGFEQGKGLDALHDHRRQRGLTQLSPEERQASATLDLREARMLLRVAEGSLVGASWEQDPRGAADLLADALADLAEARERLEDARAKLGLDLGMHIAPDLGEALGGFSRPAGEIAIGSLGFQDRLDQLREGAARTRLHVEQVLDRLAA